MSKFGEIPSINLGVYAVKVRNFAAICPNLTTIFIRHVRVSERIGRSQFLISAEQSAIICIYPVEIW